MPAGRVFSRPCAKIGTTECEVVDKGVSAVVLDKSPRKPEVTGVNAEEEAEEERSHPWVEKALQPVCGAETQRAGCRIATVRVLPPPPRAVILGSSWPSPRPPSSTLRPEKAVDVMWSDVCFLPTAPNSSDTIYLEIASDSTGQGLSLPRHPRQARTPFRCQSQALSSGVLQPACARHRPRAVVLSGQRGFAGSSRSVIYGKGFARWTWMRNSDQKPLF